MKLVLQLTETKVTEAIESILIWYGDLKVTRTSDTVINLGILNPLP